ncbi:MAG TPA: hypothetical protein VIY73_09965, partial [Polyangiaceae bacterium]
WRVARWLDARLDDEARARVARARARAVEVLLEEVRRPVAPELHHALGVPTAAVVSALAFELASTLWSPGDAGRTS